MDPSLLITPRTPPLRAVSEGPTPPPRNSMEDADSSVKRKRPRLDSGEKAYRSMSAEPSSTNLTASDPRQHSSSFDPPQPVSDPSIPSGSANAQPPMPSGTPSKMTINVREANSAVTAVDNETGMQESGKNAAEKGEVSKPGGASDEPILIGQDADPSSPSPLGSPEIEVAEPEEMSGHVGPTVWHKPGVPAESLELQQRKLFLAFPFVRETDNFTASFQKLHDIFARGDIADGRYLLAVAKWLRQWLVKVEKNPSTSYELYSCGYEFWNDFPHVINGIIRRSPGAPVPGFFLKHDDESFERNPLNELLTAYVEVCARFLQMDRQTLMETMQEPGVDPDLGSRPMMIALAGFLSDESSIPLYKLLQRGGWQIQKIAFDLAHTFTAAPYKGLDMLSACVTMLLERVPFDWEFLSSLLECATSIASHAGSRSQLGEQHGRELAAELLDLFKICDGKLRLMVEKQVSFLTHEILKHSISILSALLRQILTVDQPTLEALFPEDLKLYPVGIGYESCPPSQRIVLCELAWKFDLLLKCITAGRMDSRMTGVEEMQSSLLGIYGEYIKGEHGSMDGPVVQYAANFLLEKKVVDYLVGVDSHPRLLSESKNIIAYLAVTQKYTTKEIDMIWNSVLSSQDPRITEAILGVMRSLMDMAEAPIVSYILQKLMELPIEAYDSKMAPFTAWAVNCRWSKCSAGVALDPAMFHVLVRFLRECPAGSSMYLSAKLDFFRFAVDKLQCLPFQELSSEEKKGILRRIIEDISEASSASTGSIVTLNVIWNRSSTSTEAAIRELGSPSGFAALLVDDFARLRETEQLLGLDMHEFPYLLQDRLHLIQKVIVDCPNVLSSDQMVRLWDNLVGEGALNNDARDKAWAMLTNGAQQAQGQRNSFFDRCVVELLPKLAPQFLTPVVLEFASQLTGYEDHLARSGSGLNSGTDALPGDIFWHIALNVANAETGLRAISAFVERNVSPLEALPKDVTSERHTRLVERCIQSLTGGSSELRRMSSGSASSDEDSMVIVPSDSDLNAIKLRFIRSLSILKMFIQRIRDKLPASPGSATSTTLSEHVIQGDEISIRYQPHVSGKPTGIFTLKIGDMAPLEDLVSQLSKQTGFSEFQLIAAGQRINQAAQADVPICNIKPLLTGVLLIQKVPGSKSNKGNGAFIPLLPLEQKVMNHFQELYDLLCINEQLGCEVYNFLITFPPHDDVLTMASDGSQESSDIFPISCPYKALYSVYALKKLLMQRLQEGAPCDNLLKIGVQKLADVLVKAPLPTDGGLSSMQTKLIGALVECMLRFLKEPVSEATSNSYFEQPTTLADRLRELLLVAEIGADWEDKTLLIYTTFAAWLEACLHCPPMWDHFKENASSSSILQRLWLQCDRSSVRLATTQAVKAICTTLPESNRIGAANFVTFFWTQVVDIIPEAARSGERAEQFFQIAIELFRKIDDFEAQALPLSSYLETWMRCLLNHEHEENIGHPSPDVAVAGLTALLDWCLQLLKARKTPLAIAPNAMSNIFMNLVFPSDHLRDDNELVRARVPVLDSRTRASLYSLLFSLVTDTSSYHNLIRLLKQLIPAAPERSYAWMSGHAQISDDVHYDLTYNFERNRAIRSSTGYAGMKNLSNTCYLNSLLMQLFMNVDFRNFMLSIELDEEDESHKLLIETKKLFAYLQETWLKSVDPDNVVSCISTFDGQPIDVNVQMDVDEFYNLLFDRWESQIPTEGDKKTFRNFYGGQLVQQIKSQDCPHISERFEPFSVIQCDIQGKTGLTESLSAFIEGEMMQGDNKYKCSTCDSYVNAIKRACLKDIPDNLIFHLKRFDYDLMNGTRSKVNDYFEFPQEIDMAPYNVEYLKDTQQVPTPDRFILVGILVHSGNAEAGHYYSYIRERPGYRGTWVEMNDADVTYFDPAFIRDQCFGGLFEQPYTGLQYPKTWNAYMLFYQRASSMEAEEQRYPLINASSPVRAIVPLELANHLNSENEQWIRKFCLFDPEYAAFTRKVVEHYRKLREDQCSEDHGLERDLIHMIVHQLDMVFTREKDGHIERDLILDCLWKMVERCALCCEIYLQRLVNDERTLRALILRCPDDAFRKRCQILLFNSLKLLKERNLRRYSLELDSGDTDSSPGQSMQMYNLHEPGLFQDTILALRGLYSVMHLHSRMWDEYYLLLIKLASIGRWEKSVVYSAGFLTYVLQILIGESRADIGIQWPAVELYLKARNRRRISFKNLVALLTLLLKGASDLAKTSDSDEVNAGEAWTYDLSVEEQDIIIHTSWQQDRPSMKHLTFLQGVFAANNIETSVIQDLVRTLVQDERFGRDHLRHICNTILRGTVVEPAALAAPYLSAGLAFCETCPEGGIVKQLLTKYAKDVASINDSGGSEHLEFFSMASDLYNSYITNRHPNFFQNEILKLVPTFAPHLLFYPEREVRLDTVDFLKALIFDRDFGDDEILADRLDQSGRQLLEGCVRLGAELIRARKPLEIHRVGDFNRVTRHLFERYIQEQSEEWEVMSHQIRRICESMTALAVSSPDEMLSQDFDSEDALTETSNVD